MEKEGRRKEVGETARPRAGLAALGVLSLHVSHTSQAGCLESLCLGVPVLGPLFSSGGRMSDKQRWPPSQGVTELPASLLCRCWLKAETPLSCKASDGFCLHSRSPEVTP